MTLLNSQCLKHLFTTLLLLLCISAPSYYHSNYERVQSVLYRELRLTAIEYPALSHRDYVFPILIKNSEQALRIANWIITPNDRKPTPYIAIIDPQNDLVTLYIQNKSNRLCEIFLHEIDSLSPACFTEAYLGITLQSHHSFAVYFMDHGQRKKIVQVTK